MDRSQFVIALAGAAAAPPRSGRLVEERGRGRLGIAAIDLRNGRRLLQRGSERFPLASTFKLPLVMDVLSRVDRGRERLDRKLAFRASEILPYSPAFGPKPHEGALTVAQLCESAIEHSDNTAANLLLRAVGGPPAVTAYLRSLGDEVTRLDRSEPALNEARPGDVRDTTSPLAMAYLLAKLARDPVLSAASKARLFGWLRACDTGLTRIRAGVPAGWTVGDKTGTTDTGGNDVAILWPPADRHTGPSGGAPIVLAVYFAEVKASDTARDAVIASAARSVVHQLRA